MLCTDASICTIEALMKIYNVIAKIWQYMMDNGETSLSEKHIGVFPAVSRYKQNYNYIVTNDIDDQIVTKINKGIKPKYIGFYHSFELEDTKRVICLKVVLAEFDKPMQPVLFNKNRYFSDSKIEISMYLDKNIFLFNIENSAKINAEENCIYWFTMLFQLIGMYLENDITFIPPILSSLFVGGGLNRSASKMAELVKNSIIRRKILDNSKISNYDYDNLATQFEKLRKIQEINSPIINIKMDVIKNVISDIENIEFKSRMKDKDHIRPFEFTFMNNPLYEEDDKSDSGLISEE